NGRARSDQGEPHGAAECGLGCRTAPHHRGDGCRAGRREEECRRPCPRRNGRNGRNGRDGYVTRVASCPFLGRSKPRFGGAFCFRLPEDSSPSFEPLGLPGGWTTARIAC